MGEWWYSTHFTKKSSRTFKNSRCLYLTGTFLFLVIVTLGPDHAQARPLALEEDEDFNDAFFDSQKDSSSLKNIPEHERMIVRVIVTSSSSSSFSDNSHQEDDNHNNYGRDATFHDFEFPVTPPSTTTQIPVEETTKKDVEDIFSAFYKAFNSNNNNNGHLVVSDASHNVERFFYPPLLKKPSIINNSPGGLFPEQNFQRSEENKDFGGDKDELKVVAVSSSSSSSRPNYPRTSFSSLPSRVNTQSRPNSSNENLDRRTRRRNNRSRQRQSAPQDGPVIVTVSSSSSSATGEVNHQPMALSLIQTTTTPSWQQPEKVWGEPAQVWGEPEKVWGEPAKVWGEPAKVWGQPEQLHWGHPTTTTQSPTTRRPRFISRTPRKPKFFSTPRNKFIPPPPLIDEDYLGDAPEESSGDDADSGGSFVVLGEEDPEQDSIDGAFDHHLGLPPVSPRPISLDQFKNFNFSYHQTFSNLNLSSLTNTSQSNYNNSSLGYSSSPSSNSSESDNNMYVMEGSNNVRRYRVEERTPDGFIVGEYGVLNNQNAFLRGVRYTADGSINPRLIHEALMKFLALRR